MVQSRKIMNRKQKVGGSHPWYTPEQKSIYNAAYEKHINFHKQTLEYCDGSDASMTPEQCKEGIYKGAVYAGEYAVQNAKEAAEAPAEGGKRRTRKAKKSNKQRKTKGGKKTAKKGKKSYKKKSTRRRH